VIGLLNHVTESDGALRAAVPPPGRTRRVTRNVVNAQAAYTAIVTHELNMENLANLKVGADYSELPGGSPLKRISLVE
jgi:hypothetical protein